MTESAASLPVGLAGLRYPITQVSLVVDDIDELLKRYHMTFGWAPWQDFDHVPPVHHNQMYRGREVDYSLRGAEVYVGSLNFELLNPLPGGESLFHDHLANRGEGIASIASMFHERADGDAVKVAFKDTFGLDVINKADIGDHIEYYYVDTQEAFGCPIESGSGHAIDFVGPARIYPDADTEFGPSPDSGITYGISQVTLVARDLGAKVRNYHRAFGWGPWQFFDSRQPDLFDDVRLGVDSWSPDFRLAQTMVGDINFEIIEPRGSSNPWQAYLDTVGEGLIGISVMPKAPHGLDEVTAQFSGAGIGELVSLKVGDNMWRIFDTQDRFKTLIACGTGHAYGAAEPESVFES